MQSKNASESGINTIKAFNSSQERAYNYFGFQVLLHFHEDEECPVFNQGVPEGMAMNFSKSFNNLSSLFWPDGEWCFGSNPKIVWQTSGSMCSYVLSKPIKPIDGTL